ncbi:MAG: DUF6350 family protein [Candidatus Nanopelagicaceae bacterium]
MTRILRVGLQQGIRSLTLVLLPISFFSLVAWATAGSSSGNTADPLRAALWFFLAAHQVPLQLALSDATLSGSLTFLPVGGVLIPFFATRSGYMRMIESLGEPAHKDRFRYIFSFAFSYATLGYLISLIALGSTVEAPYYFALPILFAISAISAFLVSGALPMHKFQFPWQRALRVVWISCVTLIGFSSLVVAASLTFHFDVVLNLTRVIEPGVFGGLVLLIGQLLYLPNVAISALSYVSGAGITIGTGSLLSPFIHRIDEIPAIPILGALPVKGNIYVLTLSIVIVFMGASVARYAVSTYSDFSETKRFFLSATLISVVLLLVLARLSSGQLLSTNLPSVGPVWWAMPLIVTTEFALGAGIFMVAPKLIAKMKKQDA